MTSAEATLTTLYGEIGGYYKRLGGPDHKLKFHKFDGHDIKNWTLYEKSTNPRKLSAN